jgi:hypothetical protein
MCIVNLKHFEKFKTTTKIQVIDRMCAGRHRAKTRHERDTSPNVHRKQENWLAVKSFSDWRYQSSL